MSAWKHPYSRDPQSGAGNCVCGRQERHKIHPHAFMLSGTPGINNCVCTEPYGAHCHTMARGDLT